MIRQSKRFWVLIAVAVLVVVGATAVYVFAVRSSGPGISANEIAAGEGGLDQTIEAARAGDVEAAIEAFMGQPHDLTHRIDSLLYQQNPELAKEVGNAVIQLENELAAEEPEPARIVEAAQRVKELIRMAAAELGVKGYGSSSVQSRKIVRISDQPVDGQLDWSNQGKS